MSSKLEPSAATAQSPLNYWAGEFSGAFGDLGALLPYSIAAIGAGLLAPTPVFLGFALGYLMVALIYRAPTPIQPMKAFGAMIIAGELSAPEIAWGGAAAGAALLLLAITPQLARAARAIPQSVVTGLQAGLGLVLSLAAIKMMAANWALALPALGALALSFRWSRCPWALLTVLAGVALGVMSPAESAIAPEAEPIGDRLSIEAVAAGLAAQLPLTLLNAVVVAAAVTRSLFPAAARTVSERRLAVSSGLLNLICAPLGALPMCHGAGGAAAHHRFGARGAGAPLILAAVCAAAALSGPTLIALLTAIPAPIIGALLMIAAGSLIATPRMLDARPDCRPVIAATAIATLFLSALGGLIAGLLAEHIRKAARRRNAAGGLRR
ncbi:MAG: putative sulfate/molybdate transporter [Neomegalonema sp.]|nr:putative sulfate/molybdate transporter [Neomegalonema sp.]